MYKDICLNIYTCIHGCGVFPTKFHDGGVFTSGFMRYNVFVLDKMSIHKHVVYLVHHTRRTEQKIENWPRRLLRSIAISCINRQQCQGFPA